MVEDLLASLKFKTASLIAVIDLTREMKREEPSAMRLITDTRRVDRRAHLE